MENSWYKGDFWRVPINRYMYWIQNKWMQSVVEVSYLRNQYSVRCAATHLFFLWLDKKFQEFFTIKWTKMKASIYLFIPVSYKTYLAFQQWHGFLSATIFSLQKVHNGQTLRHNFFMSSENKSSVMKTINSSGGRCMFITN